MTASEARKLKAGDKIKWQSLDGSVTELGEVVSASPSALRVSFDEDEEPATYWFAHDAARIVCLHRA